ncbi:MAG: adenylate/guanylate cyclase domain-containing protein [Solirubrobacteraceae bacterium]
MSVLSRMIQTVRGGVTEVMRPGESELSGLELWRMGRAVLTLVIVGTNLVGAGAVLGIALFVVPIPSLPDAAHVRLVNALLAAVYVALAVPAGALIGTHRLLRMRNWLLAERQPSLSETRAVLQAPLRLFALQVWLWLIAAILFGVLDAGYSTALSVRVAIIVVITGLVTASCAYLLTELLLRPAAVRALARGAPGRLVVPGVATRAVLAWFLGTGLPLIGVVALGVLALVGDRSVTVSNLGLAIVVLGATGIAVGLLAVTVAARATADPVDSVRRALAEVQRGDFGVHVPVYDGTQIGQLQLGFNAMVAGLAERERIREAFGVYVDRDVAEHILEEGTNLSGEEVEVTVMFVDVRAFTSFAERTSADHVVAAVNELFEQIVPIIHAHRGRVDKFVGDGLLAVFGAPRRQSDHADQALAAALEIARSVRSSHGLTIGIGLNSGTVVAGNVGGAGRLEFSVIGDPVNVASRVEAATRDTGDTILITESVRSLLRSEHPPLSERHGIELKGKREAVRLYAPEPAGPGGVRPEPDREARSRPRGTGP